MDKKKLVEPRQGGIHKGAFQKRFPGRAGYHNDKRVWFHLEIINNVQLGYPGISNLEKAEWRGWSNHSIVSQAGGDTWVCGLWIFKR
jgi:hypothetical protein